MNIYQSVLTGFKNYSNGSGRASRSEYWCWTLFCFLGNLSSMTLDLFLFDVPLSKEGLFTHPISAAFTLLIFLPSLSVSIRRLHDIDRKGAWLFLGFTLVGLIYPLLVWSCKKGTEGKNRFGADPLSSRPMNSSKPPRTYLKVVKRVSLFGGIIVVLIAGAFILWDSVQIPALLAAVDSGDTKKCEQLLLSGADVNQKDNFGTTALIYASYIGNESTVRLLIQHGAALNATDMYGSTALMVAAEAGHGIIVDLLLEHGADASLKDDNGETALKLAKSMDHPDIVEKLRLLEGR